MAQGFKETAHLHTNKKNFDEGWDHWMNNKNKQTTTQQMEEAHEAIHGGPDDDCVFNGESMQNPDTVITQAEINTFFGNVTLLAKHVHQNNVAAGWWTDTKHAPRKKHLEEMGLNEYQVDEILRLFESSDRKNRNMGELLCLVHSEVSEAMEGDRKGLMDDKLPHRTMLEVELADAVIRILDIAGSKNFDLGKAILEKIEFNANRADHKLENRMQAGGKAY